MKIRLPYLTPAALILAVPFFVADIPPQDPPRTLEPGRLQPAGPRERKPTTIVFGHPEGAFIRRLPVVGATNIIYGAETGEEWGRIRLVGVRIGAYEGDDAPVTMEEYGAWLEAGSPEDVDAFLAELRGE